MSGKILEEDKEKSVEQPKNMVIYNPNAPVYSREHLCIYLRELYDLAEKEEEARKRENKTEDI